jgi:hypothetical protein
MTTHACDPIKKIVRHKRDADQGSWGYSAMVIRSPKNRQRNECAI